MKRCNKSSGKIWFIALSQTKKYPCSYSQQITLEVVRNEKTCCCKVNETWWKIFSIFCSKMGIIIIMIPFLHENFHYFSFTYGTCTCTCVLYTISSHIFSFPCANYQDLWRNPELEGAREVNTPYGILFRVPSFAFIFIII